LSYIGLSIQTRSVDEQDPSPTHIDPLTLKDASISISYSQVEQGSIFDQKLPLGTPTGEGAQVSAWNVESEPAVHSRYSSSNSNSEEAPSRPTSSVANSLTSSTTTTARQQSLQEQEQASASQLASLEASIDSAEWVSRAEYNAQYNTMAAEMNRLRAEVAWLRDAQESDWALGLSDEVPPPYSHTRVEHR
jgi:flagellar capping protein FliD